MCPIIKLGNISQSDLVKMTYHFFFLQLLVRWSIFSFLWLFVFLLRIAALCDLSIFLQHCLSFF